MRTHLLYYDGILLLYSAVIFTKVGHKNTLNNMYRYRIQIFIQILDSVRKTQVQCSTCDHSPGIYTICALLNRSLAADFSSQPGDSVLSLFNPKPASLTNNHLLGKNCQLIHILKQNLCHHNTVSLWPCQCSLCCSCDSLWFFRYVQAGQSNLQFQLLLFES